MKLKRLAFLGAALPAIFAAGCASLPEPEASTPVAARQITQSSHCGPREPGIMYIRSAAGLARFSELPNQNLAIEKLRQTDFEREHLVVTALGQKPTSGYRVILSRAVQTGSVLRLSMTVREPGRSEMVLQAIGTPCAVVAVPAGSRSEVRVSGMTTKDLTLVL